MASFLSDLAFAVKSLRAARWTAVAAVVTLALGTGANTAVLAVAYGVLLRPLPFAAPDRLVVIDVARRYGGGGSLGVPLKDFSEWRRRLTTVESVAAFAPADLIVRGVGDPTSVRSLLVTGAFFDVLGARPAAGSLFHDSHATAIVVSERYARRENTGDSLIGRAMTAGGVAVALSGVMPQTFAFPNDDVEAWIPSDAIGPLQVASAADGRSYRLLARLRPGVSIAQARQDAERVRRELAPASTGSIATVVALDEVMAGGAKPALLAFIAAAALLLLVACANVAMLLVGRAAAHRRDLAVRLALGASPGRLVRHALDESLLLALAGSALGLAVASLVLRLFLLAAGSAVPRLSAVALDLPVMAGAAAVALVVTLLCGLVPAVDAARTDFAPAFRQTATSAGASRVRGPLVVVQVALAIVLLTGAGLFARTVIGLLRGHGGVQSDHVLTARLMLTEGTSFRADSRREFVQTLLEHVRRLPGVTAAGVGGGLPPRHAPLEFTVRMVNEDAGKDSTYVLDLVPVSAGYLDALGIRPLQGRLLDVHDEQAGTPVAMMSASAARDLSWGTSPLDRELVFRVPTASGPRARPRVIGIVSDVHYAGLDENARDNLYVTWGSLPTGTTFLAVRTSGDPSALMPAVTRVVRDLDPGLPVLDVRTLDDEMNLAIAGRELRLRLVAAFALVAFLVAVVGLAAALARSVVERQKELAIRLALGATPASAVAVVALRGAVLVGAGVVIGLGSAAASGRWLATLLVGVSPYNPATYATVAALVCLTAALACYLPARRASRIDPLELLRAE